jgi:molecular chaperone DnaJ
MTMASRTLDPYAALGIPAGASHAEAARAHRRLAKQFHPDVNPGRAAAERMRRINEAWRILSNPARRSRYDAERSATWPGPGYRTTTGAGSWAGPGYGGARSYGNGHGYGYGYGYGYGGQAGAATWETWPESRRAAPRTRRPARPDPIEPSFGDRPAVFVAVWALMGLLVFLGTWLGSVAP